MEAYTDKHGLARVKMTDKNGLWVDTGDETIFIYRSAFGVRMTLWAKDGVKYTKKTRSDTIVTIEPKR